VQAARPQDAPASPDAAGSAQADPGRRRRPAGGGRGTKTERPYLLRGRLTCGLCGRRLQGSWHHGEAYYRCQYGAEYARSAALDHPKVVYLRERDLLPHLDDWLGRLFDPENVDATCEAILGAAAEPASPADRIAATAALRECDRKLDRYRALLEAGTDPAVVAGWIEDVQKERSRAQAALDAIDSSQRIDLTTASDVREAVEHLGGLVGLLQVSDAKLRTRFYEEADVLGTYLPDSRSVDIEADPCVRKVRVGGGTSTPATRPVFSGEYAAAG